MSNCRVTVLLGEEFYVFSSIPVIVSVTTRYAEIK